MKSSFSRIFSNTLLFLLGGLVAVGSTGVLFVYAAGVWPSSPASELAGGLYSEFFRKILGTPSISTYTGDGTVKNADTLGTIDSLSLQIRIPADCASGFYLTSIAPDGTLGCLAAIPPPPVDPDCGCLTTFDSGVCTFTPSTYCCGGGVNGASCTLTTVGVCTPRTATCTDGIWNITN